MIPKYSLVHLTDITKTPDEIVRIAGKTGFDYVSLRTIPMGLKNEIPYDISSNKQLFRKLRDALNETGVILNDIENARIYDGVDIKSYEPSMASAAELGVKHILTNIWTNDKNYYIDKFGELCELASNYNQIVNIEFVTWANVKNLDQAKELIIKSKMKNVGIVVDALHFYRSKVQINELGDLPKSWFNFVHLCDAGVIIPDDQESLIHTGRAERLYPGEGVIDMKSIIKNLPNAIRGIEVPNIKRVNEFGTDEHVRRSIEYAKIYFNDEN